MGSHAFERRAPGPGGSLPRVLFVDDQWGYGPVVMAIAIAEELEGRAVPIFAGQGPSFELARRSCFDRLVHTDTMARSTTRRLDLAIGSCDAVVSVMNERVARRAAARRVPCLYVDSLLWMYPEPPDVPAGVPYCQENFFGSPERLMEWRHLLHEPEIVGPLVARPGRAPSEDPDVALVNFGGLSCPALEPPTLTLYADTMAQCVLAALERWRGRVVITTGRHVIDRMDRQALRRIRSDVELADLSHDAYLSELGRSRVLVSSAGMHAMYEACAWAVPCIYLPAQNLSQALVLEALRREGGIRVLDWQQIYGLRGLDPADEVAACLRIAEAIHRFEGDQAARRALVDHLRGSLDGRRLRGRLRWQREFFDALGERGAPRVAARILALLNPSTMPPSRSGRTR